jgi:molecular chaperone Hsp33
MSEGEGTRGPKPELSAGDIVLPFQTVRSRVTGRLVRLGGTVDQILKRHEYPDSVSETLGEALALAALIGVGLKFDGRLILQTKTDGPLDMLVADFATPGALRGYASFDAGRCGDVASAGEGALLGTGHLAMTIDPNGDMDRYQGLVALDNTTLTEAADTYFRQSEQLPTFIRLAVARERGAHDGTEGVWRWRAGGIMLQHIAHEGGRPADELAAAEERGAMLGEDDDHWQRVTMLAATVEDHELVDPTLSPERLLYRLFHEEGVRVQEPRGIGEYCTCSRERVLGFLAQFGSDGLADMLEPDGSVSVTCEFCSKRYVFDPNQID